MATTLEEEKKYVNQEAINQAMQALKNQQAVKPGEYQSPWQSQISEMMDKILNREPFSYNLNADPLYNQYKDQYMRGGKLADGLLRGVFVNLAALDCFSGGYSIGVYDPVTGDKRRVLKLMDENRIGYYAPAD